MKVKRVDPGVGPQTLPISHAFTAFFGLIFDGIEEPIEKLPKQQNVPFAKHARGRPRKVPAVVL